MTGSAIAAKGPRTRQREIMSEDVTPPDVRPTAQVAPATRNATMPFKPNLFGGTGNLFLDFDF